MNTLRETLVILSCLFISGCVSKSRLTAEYEAPLSAVRASVRSAVVVRNPETLEGNQAYAVINIQPIGRQSGTPIGFTAGFEKTGTAWLQVGERRTSWSWSDPGPLIELLNEHGYSSLNASEMKRLNHTLFNSLSSPKGFVLEGQGREIHVLKAEIEYGANINSSKAASEWVAAQPAAAPDASRR
jgi:hypothetical protein